MTFDESLKVFAKGEKESREQAVSWLQDVTKYACDIWGDGCTYVDFAGNGATYTVLIPDTEGVYFRYNSGAHNGFWKMPRHRWENHNFNPLPSTDIDIEVADLHNTSFWDSIKKIAQWVQTIPEKDMVRTNLTISVHYKETALNALATASWSIKLRSYSCLYLSLFCAV